MFRFEHGNLEQALDQLVEEVYDQTKQKQNVEDGF